MIRSGTTFVPVDWRQAFELIQSKLKPLAGNQVFFILSTEHILWCIDIISVKLSHMITALNTCMHSHGQIYSWIVLFEFQVAAVVGDLMDAEAMVVLKDLMNKLGSSSLYSRSVWLLCIIIFVSFLTNFVTSPSSKFHTTLFKVPYHPLQSTVPPSSKYHTSYICVFFHKSCGILVWFCE